MYRIALCAMSAACAAVVIAFTQPALAQSAFLTGVVVANGTPVAGAHVTASSAEFSESTRTDEKGRFVFADLTPGSYAVKAVDGALTSSITVDLTANGASIIVDVDLKSLDTIAVTAASTIRQAGTDVTLNKQALMHSPAAGAFSDLLVQLPGAARGANGVVHINGDHGDINYVVDGVSIPQELNRDIGAEFNPDDVSYIDVMEGAYPAQYGGRFAAVLNIDTRGTVGAPGFSGEAIAGSNGLVDTTVGYQTRLGRGALVSAFRDEATQRGLDPPNPESPHNAASDANQFVRYTLPHGDDFLNFTLSHSYGTFQIPNDIAAGEPASTDDSETQDDTFAALQERHAIGDRGAFSYGLGVKRSTIVDFGDPRNDWTFGERLWQSSGGSASDCANALTISNYANGTCAYSLFGDRTAYDYRLNADNALNAGTHEIRWGGIYDVTTVGKTYAVTLQPGNFLAPLFTPGSPGAAYTVTDNAPNDGDDESAYVQDTWRMGGNYEVQYGFRGDAFQLRSSEFDRGFSMVSPRLKLTRFLSPRSSVYAYYGRFFTPFSFENVSPTAAQLLNLPLQAKVAQFDLKPQRDSDYEIGGHLPMGTGDLGLRVMQKDAKDLIDDTQVGVTLLHQDINYQVGRIATQSAYYQLPLSDQGRFYFTVNHTYSVNKGCETQLLAPCFGSPTDWTPADHEQRWGSTLGMVTNDARGGWFSFDGEYGSGLSSAACPPGTPGFCKYTPHITFDVERGISLTPMTKLRMRIRNLLNDEYLITYMNAQGNHYFAKRTLDVGLQFGAR
jgi:hypothetical protein